MPLSDFKKQNHFSFDPGEPINIIQQMRTEIIRNALIEKGYPEIAKLSDLMLVNSLDIIDSIFMGTDSQIFTYNDTFIVEVTVKPVIDAKVDPDDNVKEMTAVFKVRN